MIISPASPFLVGRRWLGEGMHALLPPAAEHHSTLGLAKSMILSVVTFAVPLLVYVAVCIAYTRYDTMYCKEPRGVAIATSPADRRRKIELWYTHQHG